MEHSNQLLLEAEQLKSEIHQYQQLLEQKQIDVDILQQKYQQCEHEKSNLVHSLEACLQYQHHHTGGNNVKGRASYSHEGITQMTSSSSFPPSTPLSSEKMRNIYHELGKRQSDIHALSLALAQVTTERNQLSEENNSLKGNLRSQEEEILKMKQEQERMMEMSLKDADNRGRAAVTPLSVN